MAKTNQTKETQKTPNERYEIPIPKRGDVFKVFKNAAKPQKQSTKRGPKEDLE
jgi:hypothetical protein